MGNIEVYRAIQCHQFFLIFYVYFNIIVSIMESHTTYTAYNLG